MHNIIFDRYKSSDIFTLAFIVKSGRRYEKKSEYQISHLLEHMLTLKGSKYYSFNLANKIIENCGAAVYSSTSLERTKFVVQGPIKYFEKITNVFLDNIFNPLFDKKIFESEKKILIQENRIRYKNPENILVDKILSSIFGESELFNENKEKIILNTSIDKLKSFYKKYYIPSNYIFILSSPDSFLIQKFKKIINQFELNKNLIINKKNEIYFRSIDSNPPHRFFYPNNQKIYSIFIYYLLTNLSLKESIYLDLIANLLTFGQDSLLYQELRFKNNLSYGIKSFTNHKSDCSLFLIKTDSEMPQKTIKIILKQLKNLKINSKEVANLKNKIYGSVLRNFLNPLNRINALELFWIKNEKLDLEFYFKILNNIKKEGIDFILKKISKLNPIIGLVGPQTININKI